MFEPSMSGAPLTTPVLTLNLPLIGVVESIHSVYGPYYQRLLDLVVATLAGWRDGHVDGLFTRRTAAELLWGYEVWGQIHVIGGRGER
eukprot:247238-Chlamydomonas_euryale.AAC.1